MFLKTIKKIEKKNESKYKKIYQKKQRSIYIHLNIF